MSDELITSSEIYEYDIRKANISVLYDAGVISKNTYIDLYNAERMVRQVFIGKLQRDNPEVTNVLQQGIKCARDIFIERNNITEDNIIRISNDALYTTGTSIQFTKISPHVEFVMKNKFTSYMKIFNYEFFYYYDPISDTENYKILGINNIECHQDYFIQLILAVFNTLETISLDDGLELIMDFIYSYENFDYPVQFYREFNSSSQYRMYDCLLDSISESDKYQLNIENNLTILYSIRNVILRQLI